MNVEPRKPVVLAIDSAGERCSALIAAGESVLAAERYAMAHGQAETLLPMVDAVMRRAGLSPSALDIVATTIGPGSFTGIRVGLSAARGIALATGVRIVGVTGFEAVAAGLPPPARDSHAGFLLIALESRREDLYLQLFDQAHHALGDPTAVMPAAIEEALDGIIGPAKLIIAGDAAPRAADRLRRRPDTIVIAGSAPDAEGVLRAVLRFSPADESRDKPLPLYMRPPNVTLPPAH